MRGLERSGGRAVASYGGHGSPAAVIVASARLPERNVVTVTQVAFPRDAFTVDVRSVQAAQVSQRETVGPALDDAVLLRDDLVEELNGVRGMAPERVVVAQLDHLLTFRRDEQDSGHAKPQASCARPMAQVR